MYRIWTTFSYALSSDFFIQLKRKSSEAGLETSHKLILELFSGKLKLVQLRNQEHGPNFQPVDQARVKERIIYTCIYQSNSFYPRNFSNISKS